MASKQNPPAPVTGAGAAPVPSDHALPMAWVRVSHKSPDHIAARYLYAGYGSNLALDQMTRRCAGVDLVGGGILRNARLVFAYHLGIVQHADSTVPVGVFKVTAADVAALDRYEALGRQYERILVTVEVNGQAVRCFTYLKRDNEPEAPSDSYYATCLQGYNDWGFDSRRLRHAREHAVKHGRPQRAPRVRNAAPDRGGSEPVGSGTAEYWRTTRTPRARGPRPVGGRLGGAEYIRQTKEQWERNHPRPNGGSVNGSTATGRDGQRWQAELGADGHLVWKRRDS